MRRMMLIKRYICIKVVEKILKFCYNLIKVNERIAGGRDIVCNRTGFVTQQSRGSRIVKFVSYYCINCWYYYCFYSCCFDDTVSWIELVFRIRRRYYCDYCYVNFGCEDVRMGGCYLSWWGGGWVWLIKLVILNKNK